MPDLGNSGPPWGHSDRSFGGAEAACSGDCQTPWTAHAIKPLVWCGYESPDLGNIERAWGVSIGGLPCQEAV